MTRAEFPQKVRKAAWDRANGFCECGCGRPFGTHPKERPEYHHRVEAYKGGDASLENCLCIRTDCHAVITATESAPGAAKVRREDKRRARLEAPKRKLPGGKKSPWKLKVGGGAVPREE
jgi:hypothetical protein